MTERSPAPQPDHVRPLVRMAGGGSSALWIFGALMLLAALLLFGTLNARREAMVAATAQPSAPTDQMLVAPPALSVPPDDRQQSSYAQSAIPTAAPALTPLAPPPQVVTRVIERMIPTPAPLASSDERQSYTPLRSPVTIDRPPFAAPSSAQQDGDPEDRVTATRLLNPAFTVPQGAIIPAVLETALDSTRAGAVRAIVSRDVRGFDGSRILIPRGSLLYGEYASDLSAGQKRALVRWRRLTRPDAVIIDLDSPAADPLGRSGINGKIDSHFFERFGGAIVQTGLDVGSAVATRSIVDYPFIVALPGGTQRAGSQQSSQVQPTLKVQQGTSVSVFIAHDLDFSSVDR